jgi:D-alanyl-D-alanine carboxypeptidase
MIAVAVAAVAGLAPLASAAFTPDQREEMRAAVEAWKQRVHYPGLAAGLWQQGVGTFETAVGVADRRTGRRLGPDDRFEIGSITKTFTATLVLQLVERGKLRLNDPIRRYVRWVPHGDRITLRDLLNMTSGIHNYGKRFLRRLTEHPHRDWRPGEIVRIFVSKPRHCPPRRTGTASCWEYSDPNYILLGMVIRRVTGRPLQVLYERRIFDPLGMDRTEFHARDPHLGGPAAHGYIRDPGTGRVRETTDWNLSWAWAAGGATSTLADLRRWGPALATGDGVLSARMQRKRLRFVDIPGESGDDAYGLGILSIKARGVGRLLGHDGQPLGYDAFVLHAPRAKLTTAALGNTSSSADPLTTSPLDSQAMEILGADLIEALAP